MINTEKYLGEIIHYSGLLKGLEEVIKKWDFETVKGIGLYKKYTGHYSHIEMDISKSVDKYRGNKIKYIIDERLLPKEFRIEVEKSLSFFIGYLKAIKEGEIALEFNITDGSYHPVDSRAIDFQMATFLALASCFGKNIRPVNEKDIELIKRVKTDLLK